jgi:SMI1/KNR4 family protein SUKH-1
MMSFDASSLRNVLHDAAAATRRRGAAWREETAAAATAAQIEELLSVITIPLPQDFRSFLSVADGLTLAVRPAGTLFDDTLEVWGTARIAEFYRSRLAHDTTWPLLLPFGQYDADFFAFDTRRKSGDDYPILFVEHDNPAWAYYDQPIADSFGQWFASALHAVDTGGTFGYWFDKES